MISKTATAPATTTTSGWASQLVESINVDFMPTLTAAAVYPSLSRLGLRLDFGRAGHDQHPVPRFNADDCRIVCRRRFAHPGAARRLHAASADAEKARRDLHVHA